MTNEEFFRLVSEHKQYVNPLGATAQCAHETKYKGKYWNSDLWIRANNPAGIKTLKNWTGKYIDVVTWEQYSDSNIAKVPRQFLKFDTVEAGVNGYVNKVRENYPSAVKSANNVWGYLHGIMHGKYGSWATDRKYFEKLVDSVMDIAGDCLGDSWKSRLNGAFEYSIANKLIDETEKEYIEKRLV